MSGCPGIIFHPYSKSALLQHILPEILNCRRHKNKIVMNHIKTPLTGRRLYGKNVQLQLFQQVHIRHHGDPKAPGRQPGNHLVFFCLTGGCRPGSRFRKNLFHHLPESGAFRKIDHGIWQQILRLYTCSLRQRMMPAPPGLPSAEKTRPHPGKPGYVLRREETLLRIWSASFFFLSSQKAALQAPFPAGRWHGSGWAA